MSAEMPFRIPKGRIKRAVEGVLGQLPTLDELEATNTVTCRLRIRGVVNTYFAIARNPSNTAVYALRAEADGLVREDDARHGWYLLLQTQAGQLGLMAQSDMEEVANTGIERPIWFECIAEVTPESVVSELDPATGTGGMSKEPSSMTLPLDFAQLGVAPASAWKPGDIGSGKSESVLRNLARFLARRGKS